MTTTEVVRVDTTTDLPKVEKTNSGRGLPADQTTLGSNATQEVVPHPIASTLNPTKMPQTTVSPNDTTTFNVTEDELDFGQDLSNIKTMVMNPGPKIPGVDIIELGSTFVDVGDNLSEPRHNIIDPVFVTDDTSSSPNIHSNAQLRKETFQKTNQTQSSMRSPASIDILDVTVEELADAQNNESQIIAGNAKVSSTTTASLTTTPENKLKDFTGVDKKVSDVTHRTTDKPNTHISTTSPVRGIF